MSLLSIFARHLSRRGHKQRKQSQRELYKATHDDLCRRLGRPSIPWRES